MCLKILQITTFSLIYTIFFSIVVFAQSHNFLKTGNIRPVISEAKTNSQTRQNFSDKFEFVDKSTKIDFYLSYSEFKNTAQINKWVKLPNDRNWGEISNQTVEVKGNYNNGKLSDVSIKELTKFSLGSPPPTTGLYKFATIPLTIQNSTINSNQTGTSITPEQIRDVLLDDARSVSKFFDEASYGQFQITGVNNPRIDVIPVTIEANVTSDCQNQIVTEFTPFVEKRLLDNNIDTSNGDLDLGIIIFPDLPNCPNFPFATRGALGAKGVPFWLWIPESNFLSGPSLVTHEIGHAIGGNHTAALRCTDFDDPKTCVTSANINDRDMMTFGGVYYLMPNNYERLRWGWHPPNTLIERFEGSFQLFDLHSPILPFIKESPKRGRFFNKFLTGIYNGGWTIYPESRRNYGRFENYQNDDLNYKLGIAVRIGHANYTDPNALSLILDSNETETLSDAPLLKDQQISIGGVTIKCISEFMPLRGTRMQVQ